MRAALVERDFGEPTARANPGLVAPETNGEATTTKYLQLDFFRISAGLRAPSSTGRRRVHQTALAPTSLSAPST
jgi:hypothetical protein